ncbi:MAG: hypothetical protein MJZ01_05965 [Bacteroidales bacterium]|nr:hypothetical protein [Bacteroidales bacterium]
MPYHINNPVLVIQANDAVSRRLFIEISRYQRKVCSIIDLRGNHIEFNGEFDIYPMKSTHSRTIKSTYQLVMQSVFTDKVYMYDTRRIDNWLKSIGFTKEEITELKSSARGKYTSKAPTE